MYIERAVDHVAWFTKPLVCFWHALLASAVLDWIEDVMIRAATKALKRGPYFRFLLYSAHSLRPDVVNNTRPIFVRDS